MWLKIAIPVITLLVGVAGGMFTGAKIQKAPVCNCPELPTINIPKCPPLVRIQSIDVEKLRKVKGDFVFAPVYNGSVYMVDGNDTTKIK